MAYWKDTWTFRESNEYEYKFAGNYGAKGEHRRKKEKPTPEQIEWQNRYNKTNRIRREIKANFREDDHWERLSYERGTRKPMHEVKADFRKFVDRLRKKYRELGAELKWMRIIEIGKRGGIHVHALINRIPGADTDVLISKCWEHGYVSHTNIYNSGGYQGLAEYMAKLPDEEERKKKGLPEKLSKDEYNYSTSRNLIRPEPERKTYYRWTMRKILRDGPEPTPGYYIDKNTIKQGFNRFTGYSYLRYTEIKLDRRI